jgi:hypothetical protein
MDYLAQWKNKRMQETYANTVLLWPDIKAASVLCFGGICKYKLLDSLRISDDWLAHRFALVLDNVLVQALPPIGKNG